MERNEKSLIGSYTSRSTLKVITIAMCGWTLACLVLLVLNICLGVSKMGQFGDSFGVLNSLTTIITFAALWISIVMQKDQFEKTKSELEYSRRQEHKNSFESTFFNMIESLKHQAAEYSIRDDDKDYRGPEAFERKHAHIVKAIGMFNQPKFEQHIRSAWVTHTMSLVHYFLSLDVLLKYVERFAEGKAEILLTYYEIIASNITNTQAAILRQGIKHDLFPIDRKDRIAALLNTVRIDA